MSDAHELIRKWDQPLKPEEWERIQQHISEGPNTTFLSTTDEGTCVIFAGGAMHPRCYLDIVDDDSEDSDETKVDIFKHARKPL